jgi:hypothetical protein
MRSFAFSTLFALIPVIRLITAEGITNGDVPTACQAVCRPLVELSSVCQNNGGTADQIENCICKNTSFDVISLGSLCAICITQTNAVTDSGSPTFNPNEVDKVLIQRLYRSQIHLLRMWIYTDRIQPSISNLISCNRHRYGDETRLELRRYWFPSSNRVIADSGYHNQ